jgi:hypothetical protein
MRRVPGTVLICPLKVAERVAESIAVTHCSRVALASDGVEGPAGCPVAVVEPPELPLVPLPTSARADVAAYNSPAAAASKQTTETTQTTRSISGRALIEVTFTIASH